jgi:hypothetical protein
MSTPARAQLVVRRADAPCHQPIERLQRILRKLLVVVVREVRSMVGPEPLQRSLDRRGDPRRRQPLGAAHFGADLRRDQDVVAPAAFAKPRADDRLDSPPWLPGTQVSASAVSIIRPPPSTNASRTAKGRSPSSRTRFHRG